MTRTIQPFEHISSALPATIAIVAGVASLFTPATANAANPSWSAADSMSHGRTDFWAGNGSVLLPDGDVLVAGGWGESQLPIASTERYDVTLNAWSDAGTMNVARAFHSLSLLDNGGVLVTGGQQLNITVADVDIYDPPTNTWSSAQPMNQARSRHSAVVLDDGRVLVTGGTINYQPSDTAEIYDPSTGIWANTVSMYEPRASHTSTLLPDGRVLVTGGYVSSQVLADAEIFDPATNRWTWIPMVTARNGHTTTLLPTGEVLVAGGVDDSDILRDAEIFDPATDTFYPAAPMTISRARHTASSLPDGRVLVTGGSTTTLYPPTPTESTELYDPYAGTWSFGPDLVHPRETHVAQSLGDGRVLVAGGRGVSDASRAAELFVGGTCGNGVIEFGEDCDDGGVDGCCSASCTFEAGGTLCRPAVGQCDVAESCTGASATCPPDYVEAPATPCGDTLVCPGGNRFSTALCDTEGWCEEVLTDCPGECIGDGDCPRGSTCEVDECVQEPVEPDPVPRTTSEPDDGPGDSQGPGASDSDGTDSPDGAGSDDPEAGDEMDPESSSEDPDVVLVEEREPTRGCSTGGEGPGSLLGTLVLLTMFAGLKRRRFETGL